jgi:hypothetical protein
VTESEWLSCADPEKMLAFLRGKATNRKLRLFAVACVRRVWHLLTDARSRDAVEGAERYVDGHLNEEDFLEVFLSAANALDGISGRFAIYAASAACASVRWVFADENHTQWEPGEPFSDAQLTAKQAARAFHPDTDKQQAAQTSLVLDIVGNPFRPASVSPAWRTPQVVALAQAAYDNHTLPAGELGPARLAVLADALEETGCDNADILSHLRSSGPHVRGCFALDAILGRS